MKRGGIGETWKAGVLYEGVPGVPRPRTLLRSRRHDPPPRQPGRPLRVVVTRETAPPRKVVISRWSSSLEADPDSELSARGRTSVY